MKKLVLISSLLFSVSAFAGFKSAQEAETKLKTFSTSKFQGKENKDVVAMEDDLVDSLIDAVEFATQKNPTESLKKEILRVAVVLLKQDNTNYGGEIVLPIYNKNQQEFRELLKTLPKKDSQLLEESVKNASREASEGNG